MASTTHGWEVTDLASGNGVDTVLPWVGGQATLTYLDVDIACMSRQVPRKSGWGEMLVTGTLFPEAPTYEGPRAFASGAPDKSFGPAAVSANPSTAQMVLGGTCAGGLFSVILKFAVTRGVTATTHRHIFLPSTLPLAKGCCFSFHADSSVSVPGITMDLEMQMAIAYELA